MTPGSYPPEFIHLVRQIALERREAKPIVEMLRESIEEQLEREVPFAWRTIGFVLELNAAAPDLLHRDPATAKALAQFALAVLANIPAKSYPRPTLRAAEATAWKELANAHRYQSDYEAALRALDAADRCLADSLALGYDSAVLKLARALVYCDQHRFDEADALLAESAQTFAEHQDRRRTAQCLLVRGMGEHRRKMLHKACSTYEQVIDVIRQTNDLATLASAYNNLGHAKADLGEHGAAAALLHDALAIFSDLQMTGAVLRTRSVLGQLLRAQGRLHQAQEMFMEARVGFRRLYMAEEAGLVGLELVEVLQSLGETIPARMLLENVAAEFSLANLGERAASALASLHDGRH